MSAHDYYKTTLIYLKDNKIVMLIVLSLFGGNVFQAVPKTETTISVVSTTGCQCNSEIKKLNAEITKLKWRHR
jgi:hypothetical protein